MKNISLDYLSALLSAIEKSKLHNNILSLIVFGSLLNKQKDIAHDADFCIILHQRKQDDLNLIAKLFKRYKKLDITIYYKNELNNLLPFRDIGTGCFAMHYFATGKPLIGKNIFLEKYKKLPKTLYQHSLKEKMFDYLLRLRRVHVTYNSKQKKLSHLEKYTSRLLVDLMAYNQPTLLPILIGLSSERIFLKAKKLKIISKVPNFYNKNIIDEYLQILDEITDVLLKLE